MSLSGPSSSEEESRKAAGPLPLDVECPRCQASAGRGCVSRNIRGTWAAKTHLARWKAVGVDTPDYDDRARDYQDFKKREQDRILASYPSRSSVIFGGS